MPQWLRRVEQLAPRAAVKMLVGTKQDADAPSASDAAAARRALREAKSPPLAERVEPREALRLAEAAAMPFAAASALDGGGADEVFALLAERLLEQRLGHVADTWQPHEREPHEREPPPVTLEARAPRVSRPSMAESSSEPRWPAGRLAQRAPPQGGGLAQCLRCCLPPPPAAAFAPKPADDARAARDAKARDAPPQDRSQDKRTSAAAASAAKARARARSPGSASRHASPARMSAPSRAPAARSTLHGI